MNYLTQYYKNLSEQLQQRVNHLQRLIETANLTPNNFDGPDADRTGSTAEVVAGQRAHELALQTHGKIKDALIKLHATKYPHLSDSPEGSAVARSAAHIAHILDTHGSAPFTSAEAAVHAIAPQAIQGNYDLERRIYDTRDSGGDVLEDEDYDTFVANNEENYTHSLISDVQKAIQGKNK